MAQTLGKPVAKRGLRWGKPARVQPYPRAGDTGERQQLIRIVPDQPQIGANLVDQPGGGHTAPPMLQRR